MALEDLHEAGIACDLRRGAHLNDRLFLDRVDVGQVLDELLVAVARPLPAADACLQLLDPAPQAFALERRGREVLSLAQPAEQVVQRFDGAVAGLPAELLASA